MSPWSHSHSVYNCCCAVYDMLPCPNQTMNIWNIFVPVAGVLWSISLCTKAQSKIMLALHSCGFINTSFALLQVLQPFQQRSGRAATWSVGQSGRRLSGPFIVHLPQPPSSHPLRPQQVILFTASKCLCWFSSNTSIKVWLSCWAPKESSLLA